MATTDELQQTSNILWVEPVMGDGEEPVSRADMERGLAFVHRMESTTYHFSREASVHVRALIQVLMEKGLVDQAQLDHLVGEMREEFDKLKGPRIMLSKAENKYAPENQVLIDCENRIPLCQARCCALRFFLTPEDLDEGTARWDYGNPYHIRQREDGYCVHNDPATRFCNIHEKRPHVCRTYDCRNDKRIWIDFENYIPAPPPVRTRSSNDGEQGNQEQ